MSAVKQLDIFERVQFEWKHEGSRCRVLGCVARRSLAKQMSLQKQVAEQQGPQGAWECSNGHSGWIWPSEGAGD